MLWNSIKKEFEIKNSNEIPLLILKGVESNLELIDLQNHHAIFCKWNSKRFFKYFLNAFPEHNKLIDDLNDITKNKSSDGDDNIYILAPTKQNIEIQNLQILYEIIRLLFPSRFQILFKLEITKIPDQVSCTFLVWKYDDLNFTGEKKLNFGCNSPSSISNIITRIKIVIDKVPYIKLALGYYISSIEINSLSIAFVTLNICLEVFILGTTELTYKTGRSFAIICGKSEKSSITIFHNIQKLYNLRSAIVHGEPIKDFNIVWEYFNYLQLLVSIAVVEISKHKIEEISSLKELYQRLSILAFGQYRKLSSRYSNFKFENPGYGDIINIELSKFKRVDK